MINLKEYDISKLQRLKDDLPYFAKNYLIIKSKTKGKIFFNLNNIQLDFHFKIIKRKKLDKPCKFVVVKARQLGLSTYIEARLFHRVLFEKAKNAYILGDKHDTASSIFDMARRYYDELPACFQIPLKTNSSRMLSFETDSLFRVGTAGATVIGRGTTNNFFHGSEVAFWKNATEVVSGVLQTIPENLDSEIFLESTTNGTTGDGRYFYEMANTGLDPDSEFQTIFYPWFANSEYSKEVTEPLKHDDYEEFLIKTYNLNDSQLLWRRNKLQNEFKKREYLFKQEYPSSFAEAFIKNDNALIPNEYIESARKNGNLTGNGLPIIIGIDPARNSDRTVITIRQGRVIQKFYRFSVMNEVRLAGIILRLIQAVNPARVFIDYGHGTGTYDILVSQGCGNILELVQFGESAYDNKKYANRRAEMYDKMRDWFMQTGGVFIKDQDYIEEFVRDISIIPDLKVSDSNGKYSLEKKEKFTMGTEVHSTDFADSLALTFASPVANFKTEYGSFSNKIQVVNKNWQMRL
ncbi:MAG: hypothetical protein SPL73_05680 [Cyanobacteriota bacterium]|nr:hypothetical protein [Cyanobacteriota bacterium]MDY6364362.1 hypothetical protein [Cyanobacteriota bacterium]